LGMAIISRIRSASKIIVIRRAKPEEKTCNDATVSIFFRVPSNISKPLSNDLIQALVVQGHVLTERRRRAERRRRIVLPSPTQGTQLFVRDPFPLPPPLDADLLEEIGGAINERVRHKRLRTPTVRKLVVSSPEEIIPLAFFMELNKLQGPHIPGEARVPMDARNMAESFWG